MKKYLPVSEPVANRMAWSLPWTWIQILSQFKNSTLEMRDDFFCWHGLAKAEVM